MLVGAQIYFTRFLSSTQTWVTFEAPLLYASGTQIDAIVPYELPAVGSSDSSVQVEYQATVSNLFAFSGVVPATPGIFTAGATGSVAVSIGGQGSAVIYAGAAPAEVNGLMQVNIQVPANAPSGNLPVVVTVGTAASQGNVTIAVR
jgi:hypothetical protein